MVHEQVGRMARKRRSEGMDNRLPPTVDKEATMNQSARFLEGMAGSELGRRMLEQNYNDEQSYTPRWGDHDEYMEQDAPPGGR